MIYQAKKPVRTIAAHCSQFVVLFQETLAKAGLWTVPSFDLRSTRAVHEGCSCPHHGTDQCTCEFVVLLVYCAVGSPLTVVLDGRDGQTFVYVAEDSGTSLRSATVEAIDRAILKANLLFHERNLDVDLA